MRLKNTMVPVYRAGTVMGSRINQVSQDVPKICLFTSLAKADAKKPSPFLFLSVAERTADSPHVKSSRRSCNKGEVLIQRLVSRDLVSNSVAICGEIIKIYRFLTRYYQPPTSRVH